MTAPGSSEYGRLDSSGIATADRAADRVAGESPAGRGYATLHVANRSDRGGAGAFGPGVRRRRRGGAPNAGSPESPACPEGTPGVTARDVIGTPPDGYRIVAGDRRALARFAEQVRAQAGHRWEGYDARVLVRRGELNGVAVFVINANEKTGTTETFLRSSRRAEERAGVPGEDITIGAEPGRLRKAVDGGVIATALAGPCAITMLVADTESLVRDAAPLMAGP